MPRRHRGQGFLIAVVGLVLVGLISAIATHGFGHWVLSETEDFALGQRAFLAARASLSETLQAFKAHANHPGSTWYDNLRNHATDGQGSKWWLVGECDARLTRTALGSRSGLEVSPVRASVWRDEPADPTVRTYVRKDGTEYEDQAALLTLTADVVSAQGPWAFLGARVRRQVQRSYTLKQDRIVPPEAFAPDTLYIDSLPLLETQRDAYDALIRSVRDRRLELQGHYNGELRSAVATLEQYLAWMRAKVKNLDETEALIRRTADKLSETQAAVPLTLGMAEPAAAQLQKTLDGLKKGLKEDLHRTLGAFNLPDEATFRRIAADPYPPQRLVDDANFHLAAGSWPAFRAHAASDEGCSPEGPDLTQPIVVVQPTVRTTQVEYHVPPPPALPRRPTYSMASDQIDWTGHYARISDEFRRYNTAYNRTLSEYQDAVAREFARHEAIFHLLRSRPAELSSFLTNLGYQGRRAARFYPTQAQFLKDVVKGGVLQLDGVYAVAGTRSGGAAGAEAGTRTALAGLPLTYQGRGIIVTDGDVTIDGLKGAQPSATLTIQTAGSIRVNGPCDAALVAPSGRVVATGGTPIHGMVILGRLAHDDDFVVNRDPIYGDTTTSAQWITVSGAPLAEILLRQ